jgi:hypothetical protein
MPLITFGKEQRLLILVLYCFPHGPATSPPRSLNILFSSSITEVINLRYVETMHTYVLLSNPVVFELQSVMQLEISEANLNMTVEYQPSIM